MRLGFAVCHFNPAGYEARVRNFEKFAEGMRGFGEKVVVVELAIGGAKHELPEVFPNMIKLRSESVLWHKEALLNIGMGRLVETGFENVGWLDADVVFEDGDWYDKVVGCLKTKRLCQVFDTCRRGFGDVGPQLVRGAACDWVSEVKPPLQIHNCGYGWAMKREVWERAGLYEGAVIGGGDLNMWRGIFSGFVDEEPLLAGFDGSGGSREDFCEWARGWSAAVGMKVGYPRGVRVKALPHGRMADRRYNQRTALLNETGYDPAKHLRKNEDGVLEWSAEAPEALVAGVRRYFEGRREDVGLRAEGVK